jgi:hypothetical protein
MPGAFGCELSRAESKNRLFRPLNLVSNREVNATSLERKKTGVGRSASDGEIVRLTRTYDWRTTDQDEIKLRQQRAREEQPRIRNLEPAHNIFSQFEVVSKSGMTYRVELRSLSDRIFSCTCTEAPDVSGSRIF